MINNSWFGTWRIWSLVLLPFLLFGGMARAQSGGVLSVDKSLVIVATATDVKFTLKFAADPKLLTTSPTLQRQSGGSWVNLGRLYDDGTHGDSTAGDYTFTTVVSVKEASAGPLQFRATSAYRGVILRKTSNALQLDVVEPLGLTIQAGSSEIFILQGSEQAVVTTVTLANSGFGQINVRNETSVTPVEGLGVSSDYPSGGWNASSSQSFVLNQQFSGLTPGDYVVKNTASITGQGLSAVSSILVHVLPPGGNPVILPVGAVPGAVQINVQTLVTFTASIANHLIAPSELSLRLINGDTDTVVGVMKDDGENGDLEAGDGVYSGQAIVEPQSEGILELRASAEFPGVDGERTSSPFQLSVTCFPSTIAASDMSKVVKDVESGMEVLCNEALVRFVQPLTCAQVLAFADEFNATVVGTIPGLGVYQLRIPNPECTVPALFAVLEAMADTELVDGAVPNAVTSVDEVTPNDTDYGTQYAPQKIRADEAWVISRGGPVIAVLDTGVDYNHEDLSGKVIKGPDLVNGDNDPMDDQGHGTHVAGIAAAYGDNGKGVAGIAWKSKILAIKVADSGGMISFANGAASIKTAADLGAKIINCSWGWPPTTWNRLWAWFAGLENAVDYATAKGAIVVVAAGNEGSTAIRIPGAYANAYCVGSTTSTDSRSSFSCFGPEVDIAAPGSGIHSTLNGGGYGAKSGTSMATPCVAGAVAVVWSRFPSYSAAQIRARLQKTAVELSGAQLGSGRIDLFEAVFNGSFEDGVNGWNASGTVGAVGALGPLKPTDRKNFGFASSGPDSAQIQTTLEQSFTVHSGVTSFKLSFDYDFVTEEFPEWVGSTYNDNMRIQLIRPDGTTQQLAFESVNSSSFTSVAGIDFPGGDNTTGHTGWKTVTTTVPVTQGPGKYRIVVRDEGDGIYDSNVLIDAIRFK